MPRIKKPKPTEEQIEEPGKGHNSLSPAELKNIVERIESLTDDRAAINADIRLIMTEAESKGFDKRTIREMVKMRGLGGEEFTEREELRDMYLAALGLV